MTPFSIRDWLFSLKTFGAAVIALYIGFWMDLPRPYWAVATVYICSQPLSGATRSKAAYRICGTVLGAIVSVALVPNFVNAPELLSLAISIWVASCLYVSLLDRSPRSYVFMLAGYTAGIIGFPAVTEPGTIFDTALARLEEITLGILCASAVSGVVFPSTVGPVVAERLRNWLKDADLWSCNVLSKQKDDRASREHRLRLATDAAQLDLLSAHLAFDTSSQRHAARAMRMLRLRMLMLLPVNSSLAEKMRALDAHGGSVAPDLETLIGDFRIAVQNGTEISHETAEKLRKSIADHDLTLDSRSGPREFMIASLLLRLKDLMDIRQDCRRLQEQIETGAAKLLAPLSFQTEAGVADIRHRDPRRAALSALAALICVSGLCWFWIVTSWPEGPTAAMVASVVCCLFASQDNPVPTIRTFANWSAVAVMVTIGYLFAVLPRVQDFEMLVVALGPAFVFFGLLATKPATAYASMALSLWSATLIALQENYSADFANVANSGLALLGGIWFVTIVFQLARSAGAEWSMRRLLEASRTTLAEAAEHRGQGDRAHFAALMLDRLSLLAPMLAAADRDGELQTVDVLGELRVGLNIIELRHARHGLPASVLQSIDAMLASLAAHFRAGSTTPGSGLLDQIDLAARAVASAPPGRYRRLALLGLVGIRYTLFPDAAPHNCNWRETETSVAA
ncbi:FUSC family protein [Methylocapsa polymorpha]|uniref:FUSC family protein n=1 Tax=Methylocapsa polymorpha TaxID=3080828 RepID=A0ABZ0HR40_9HYPH|nr:FUSC family protein [Methylocapsa sp. RX1]